MSVRRTSRRWRVVAAVPLAVALAAVPMACDDDEDEAPNPSDVSTPASVLEPGGSVLQPGANPSTPNTYPPPGVTGDVIDEVTGTTGTSILDS